jgi:hypothetical protein
MSHREVMKREHMDLVIELDQKGRFWVSASDGTILEETWIAGAEEKPATLRASGLCLLEEKYMPGRWASTTLDPQEITGQLWVEASEGGMPS